VSFAVTDEDSHLWVSGAPTGEFKAEPISGCVVAFSFALVCTDPYKRDIVTRQLTTGLPYSGPIDGMEVPLVLGQLVLDASPLIGGSIRVPNLGDAPAKPLITITGPAFAPIVRNITSGFYTQWNLDLAAGAVFVADFDTGITTINGQRAAIPLIGYGSLPWSLQPGDNDLLFGHRGNYSPDTELTVSWQDRYR
jgi:hypothetical protein